MHLAVETAQRQQAHKYAPASAALKTLDFTLVRAGGLSFYSREFHSPGLKLTPMDVILPLQKLYCTQLITTLISLEKDALVWSLFSK